MTDTRPVFAAISVLLLLAAPGFAPPVAASDADSESSEADFVRDMSRRLADIERRFDALDDYLSSPRDLYAQRPRSRMPRSNARELATGSRDIGGSGDEVARMELNLERLKRKAKKAEERLNRYKTSHTGRSNASAGDEKAEKDRRKISSRLTQIENDLDQLERDLRYLR